MFVQFLGGQTAAYQEGAPPARSVRYRFSGWAKLPGQLQGPGQRSHSGMGFKETVIDGHF